MFNRLKNLVKNKIKTKGLKKTKSGNHYIPTNHRDKDIEELHKNALEEIRRDKMEWAGVMNKDMRKAAKKIEKKTKKGGRRRKKKRTKRKKKRKTKKRGRKKKRKTKRRR